MKNILFAALLLLTSPSWASIPGASNTTNTGFGMAKNTTASSAYNIPIANLNSVTLICGGSGGVSSAAFFGFYSQSAPNLTQMSYQVPAGSTFYALSADFGFKNADNSTLFGYGTSTLGSEGAVTAPPGSYKFSGANPGNITSYDQTVGSRLMAGLYWPSNSYPYVQWLGGTASSIFHICIVGIVQ